MSLSQRSRTALFLGFTEVISDEEAIEEMLSYFPSGDLDEPASKDFVRAEVAGLRSDINELRGDVSSQLGELRGEMNSLGSELRGEMNSLGSELRGDMNSLSSELRGDMNSLSSELRSEMNSLGSELRGDMNSLSSELRAEMHQGFQRLTLAMVGSMISIAAVVVAAATAIR